MPTKKPPIKAKSKAKISPKLKIEAKQNGKKNSEAVLPAKAPQWAGKVPHIKPGRYEDGLPYNNLDYLAFKLILKPNRFVSRQSLIEFTNVVKRPALKLKVGFRPLDIMRTPVKIREVLFVDTPDFRLYNNAFILRRRIEYIDGFPKGDPEIVFKIRHTDLQTCAETDVRPHIQGAFVVKFKAQVLPLKDQLGGIRMLYSQNVQFPRSNIKQNDVFSFDTICEIFPVLKTLQKKPGERIQLVNDAIVEEVLQDICVFDFGNGITAKANVGIWRTRGEHRPLIGEFAYQFKFKDRSELKLDSMIRAEDFFLELQYAAKDWIALNATKTGVVYRFLGNPPKSHE